MDKPVLNMMQRRWLQEIGIDARMLAHFSAEPFAETSEGDVTVIQRPSQVVAQQSAGHTLSGEMSPIAEAPAQPQKQNDARDETPGATLLADLLKRKPLVRSPAQPQQAATGAQGVAAAPRTDAGSLQQLREQAEECQSCGLYEVRGRLVFGEGVETAVQWMFIGEAPGGHDDISGKPFQGRPGDLLRAMLASVGIDDAAPAYYTNVLKCRPMGNRSPQPEEVAACLPLLRKQIHLLQPARLVALGRVAAGALLSREDDLDTLRGQVHSYRDDYGNTIPLVVTHHPASLLLHGQLKTEAWRDLNLLMDVKA